MTSEATFFGLSGKKALIIGGGQGMGESSARCLARAGCDVALVDLLPERAERVGQDIAAIGRQAFTIVGDVLDDGQITRIVAEAEAKLGGLDVMVSIVGAATWGSLLETTGVVWDQQMQLNLRYFFLVAKEVAQSLIRRGQGGAIVGIASVDGQRASPMRGAYGAAKAGLISLVQTMAVEWAPHHIRVNAIAPGHIVTPRLYDTPQRVEGYAAQPAADASARHHWTTSATRRCSWPPTWRATSPAPRSMSMADCSPPICSRRTARHNQT